MSLKWPESKIGLVDDVGVRLEELHERAVGELAAFVQRGHDAIVAPGRSALVHHLGLALRIEILRDAAG